MGAPHHQRSELVLVILFLGLLVAVPASQTWLELRRGERIQFTDVFRTRPTAKDLRQYEATLEGKSWVQQQARSLAQEWLFEVARDTGSKAVLGCDQWLFYRPDVRYLIEPDRPERGFVDSKWVTPVSGTRREAVVRAIAQFRDQLKERDLELLVVPVPGKPSVYPEHVTRRAGAAGASMKSPTVELIAQLNERGIATVDLFAVFQAQRRRGLDTNGPGQLYLARDTHWTPAGARLAAQAVARRLGELRWVAPGKAEFALQTVRVKRRGDILDMTQIPGMGRAFAPEEVVCEQVRDPVLGPMVPTASDRPGTYRYPGQTASVLVLGDSFSRIYQYAEPRSLGELAEPSGERKELTKRLLPGSAGFIAHLARELKAPVDAIVSDGGASTDVRRKLSTNPEILERKKVVIWEFIERDIALGQEGWEPAPLPPKMDS